MDLLAGVEGLDAFVGSYNSVGTHRGDGFGLPVCFCGDAGEGLRQWGRGAQGIVPADAVDDCWGGRGRDSGDVVGMRRAVGGGSYAGRGIPDANTAFGAAGPEGLGLRGDVHGCDVLLVALDHSLRFEGPFIQVVKVACKVQAYDQAI